jgi:hypothetical protein
MTDPAPAPAPDTELFCVAPHCKLQILPGEPRIQVSLPGLSGPMHADCLTAHTERDTRSAGL